MKIKALHKKFDLHNQGQLYIWSTFSILISLPYILILYFHKILKIRDMWSFHLSFHLLNYQDFGFVKRGLLGSIFKPFYFYLKNINLDLRLAILLTYISLLIIFIIIYWILAINSNTPKVTKLGLLLAPATFQFLGFDSPRSSELVWLIIFGLWCLLFTQKSNLNYLESIISGFAVSLSLLTYEGSLIIIFPIIFFNILFSLDKKTYEKRIAIILIFLVPVILTTFLVFKFGSFEEGSYVIRNILDKVDPKIPDTISEVIANDLIKDNRTRMLDNVNWFSNNFLFVFYFFSYLLCNFFELKNQFNIKNFILSTSSFSGIFLCLVALDYSRYIALAMLVNSMHLFILKRNQTWSNSKYWIIICFMGFLGPVGCAGMINPFPLWKFISDLKIYF